MQTEVSPSDLVGVAEIAMLEEAFKDALKCQMQHAEECTVEVVARGVSCMTSMNFCKVAQTIHLLKMANDYKCADCTRYARDCWRIIPI